MTFSFFCIKNDSLWLNITYAGLIGLLIFMSFAVPTIPERLYDFHISILELSLPKLFLKYFSLTLKTNVF